MKLITWNVNNANLYLKRLLTLIDENNPDVLCLQEVPENFLDKIYSKTEYSWVTIYDSKSNKPNKSMYILIGSKYKIINKGHKYLTEGNKSFLSSIYYVKFTFREEYIGINYIDIEINNKPYRIVTFRMSTAIGPTDRLKHMETVFNEIVIPGRTIIAGDFNVFKNPVFIWLFGFLRGYTLKEHFMKEYEKFNQMLTEKHFVNIFKGSCTMIPCVLNEQADYIVIPDNIKNYKSKIMGKYLSDHNMLMLECDLE